MHEKIDFGTGTLCDISNEMYEQGYMFDIRWKMNVHFIMRINIWTGGCWYDRESFNNYDFKSIVWVRVKLKVYITIHTERLIDDENELCDIEQEFMDLMKKYSIPMSMMQKMMFMLFTDINAVRTPRGFQKPAGHPFVYLIYGIDKPIFNYSTSCKAAKFSSPVRIFTTLSTLYTKILPSPM